MTIERRRSFAQEVIAKTIDGSDLDGSDKAFATRLVLGVVSTKGVLDLILDRCLRSPEDVRSDVRCALRIPTYEIIYLDKQTHAAVDQGVELVGHVAPKARGLANAVLRKVAAAKRSFPFGDPETDVRALAVQEGFPPWLAKFLVETYGAHRARLFMEAANEPAPIYIALNAVKASEDAFLEAAKGAKVEVHPVAVRGERVPGCFELAHRRDMTSRFVKRAIERGEICISDASAQMVANIAVRAAADGFAAARGSSAESAECSESPVDAAANLRFLELCAGRATKTILLQSGFYRTLGSQLEEFTALDNLEFKVKLLERRARDYGITVKEALRADALDLESALPDRQFDCVFLDAPCTGIGTLRRHPEIRWRTSPSAIEDAAALDHGLLASSARAVAAGGILVYATCTVTPAENQRVVVDFLKTDEGSEFKIVPLDPILGAGGNGSVAPDDGVQGPPADPIAFFQTLTTPGAPDSHFCCVLKRVGG